MHAGMRRSTFLTVATVLLFNHLCDAAITKCDLKGLCACDTDDGEVDLSPLGNVDPLYVSDASSGQDYWWRPCVNFDKGDQQGKGAVQMADSVYYELGVNVISQIMSGVSSDGFPQFTMVASDYNRQAQVTCKCPSNSLLTLKRLSFSQYNDNLDFTFDGEDQYSTPINYKFTLTAPYCCPGYVPSGGSDSSGLSVGSILTIMFFVTITCYVIIGVVIQVAVKKADGRERIPNVAFWAALPGLVRDGFMFTFTCGRRSTYSKI